MNHVTGRTLAARTGWDVLIEYRAVGQSNTAGRAILVSRPDDPRIELSRARRGWSMGWEDDEGGGGAFVYPSLYAAVVAGNQWLKDNER